MTRSSKDRFVRPVAFNMGHALETQLSERTRAIWHGRGQNAVAGRRAELRRKAKSRIEAIEAEACTRIEKLSLSAQEQIIVSGIESAAAKEFLEKLPAIDVLMPSIDILELKRLVDSKPKRSEWGQFP